jgi:UDP-N-acetylmuramoyl-tripeptide--D-alanyl-D-alanine ligase
VAERPDLDWVVQVTGGRLRQYRHAEITGFSIDSRTIKPGEFFIALRGERTDGHLFVEEAFRRGASGALVSHNVKDFHNVIKVRDTKAALHKLAQAWREQFEVPIIGITGSSGKTTTKELLFAILARSFQAYRSPGNYNTEYGLPLAILGMPRETEAGVFELGLQRPGEVGELANLLKPTVGVITNVGDAHLGFFRDREEIAENKWELIEQLPQDGLAVLNLDSPHLQRRMEGLRRAASFGIDEEADYRAAEIDDTRLEGLRLVLNSPQGSFRVGSRLLGRFNAYNILAAAAAALELGASPEDVREAVAEFSPFPHRMELRRSPAGLIIDDSYNANPSSTKAALTALADLRTRRRKIFVFGDMLELGERALEAHRGIAEVIDRLGLDLVFTLGELAGETGRTLQERGWGQRVLIADEMAELKEALLSQLADDRNLILIKGSRAMGLDRLVEALI